MNKIYFKTGIVGIICLLSFTTVPVSCSSDDDGSENTEQNTDGRKLRQLTITDVPITRATLDENGSAISALWTAGDKATLLNVSAIPSELLYGEVAASSNDVTSTFTGSVSCGNLDNVALIYPKVTPAVGVGKYQITLSGQIGTLTDIATRFHYIYGVGQVTATAENPATATATIKSMKSLLAVCKFTFKDKDTNADIPVKSLSINYNDTYYPLTGTVVPSIDAASVVATPADPSLWGRPLTVTLDAETSDGVYVALFPVSAYTFQFTVTTEANVVYTGTATATLKAGKFYNVPPLKLTKKLPSNN